ncbi:hypothetical protein F9K78_00740 [Brucella pseudintermedia]|nr:hypothetical protein F9K78_00740 [Brucella pseudintermedia]
MLHPYKTFSSSKCKNIADAVLAVHKPHAGEIGNRLVARNPPDGTSKRVTSVNCPRYWPPAWVDTPRSIHRGTAHRLNCEVNRRTRPN